LQHEFIPPAVLGTDVLCQAVSDMLVLACPQQLDACARAEAILIISPTGMLADQIKHDFDRLARYFRNVKMIVVSGGMFIAKGRAMPRNNCPYIFIDTPGGIMRLVLRHSNP